MGENEALEELDTILKNMRHDPEMAHNAADEVLLAMVSRSVEKKWKRVAEEIGFWYA